MKITQKLIFHKAFNICHGNVPQLVKAAFQNIDDLNATHPPYKSQQIIFFMVLENFYRCSPSVASALKEQRNFSYIKLE